MATCKDCLHYDVCKSYGVIMHNSLKLKMTDEVESKCPYKLFKSRTIKTNADRIRAMSDEELANIMAGTPICKERYMDCIKDGRDCEPCLLEWLKQPAEE